MKMILETVMVVLITMIILFSLLVGAYWYYQRTPCELFPDNFAFHAANVEEEFMSIEDLMDHEADSEATGTLYRPDRRRDQAKDTCHV